MGDFRYKFWYEIWPWGKKARAYWSARFIAAMHREGNSDITEGMPAKHKTSDVRFWRFCNRLFPLRTHCGICKAEIQGGSTKGVCGECDAW